MIISGTAWDAKLRCLTISNHYLFYACKEAVYDEKMNTGRICSKGCPCQPYSDCTWSVCKFSCQNIT